MSKPKLPRVGQAATSDAGVGLVKARICAPPTQGGAGYFFRELPTADKGLDGQIEITADVGGEQVATGKILSVQVKAGESFFRRDNGDSWSVYVPEPTVNYWQSHSVPVLLVLADLERQQCFWVRGDATHRRTRRGFCISVPKRNVLDARSRDALAEIAENTTEAGRRLAELESEVPLMMQLTAGKPLSVDVRHWIHKSSGRCEVTLGIALDDPYEGDPPGMQPLASWTARGDGSADAITAWLPWADAEMDDDFYEGIRDDPYDEYLNEMGTYDNESGDMIDSIGIFDHWLEHRRDLQGSMYYDEIAGEIRCYRYRITLNDFGQAFVKVYNYLTG